MKSLQIYIGNNAHQLIVFNLFSKVIVKILVLLIFIPSYFSASIAQNTANQTTVYFSNLRQEDGLPSNVINTIEQDDAGFIWVGTDEGLCRYDGHRTIVFKADNKPGALPNNNVRSILKDENLLWIGTWNGLCTIDTRSFEINQINLGANSSVRSLYKDSKNKIWIGTSNGLIIFDKSINQYQYFSSYNSKLSHSTIRCMYETQDGTMWIGTYNKLNSFKDGNFTSYDIKGNYKSFLTNNLILDIKPLSAQNDSILMIGTETGLVKFNRYTDNFTLYNSNNTSINNEVIKCIYGDKEEIWLGTDFGLVLLDREFNILHTYFHNPIINQSLANNVVWKIFRDNSNTLWLLTSNGISLINKENTFYQLHEEFYSINNQEAGNQIRDIMVTENNTVYLATIHGIIAKNKNHKKTYFSVASNNNKNILLDNAYALATDSLKRIWMGTAGGINIWDPIHNQMKAISANKKNGLTSNYISSIVITNDGAVWINAWEGGIFKITGDLKTLDNLRFIKAESSAPDIIYTCDNNIYYLNSNRLWTINNQTLTNTQVDSINSIIKDETILCMNSSQNNELWLATNKQLIKYTPATSKIHTYSIKNPVINDPISIEVDNENNVWMASLNSVIKYDVSTGSIISMPLNTNSPIKSFYAGCSAISPNGIVFFGGDNGYVVSNPQDNQHEIHAPKAIISALNINNKLYNTTSTEDSKNDISYLNKLTLDHTNNSLTFFFSTLNYWQPDKSYFRYRLKNFDHEWNSTLNTNFATYSNLSPGSYTLELEAYNYAGIKSNEVKSMAITILPPLWLSKPFLGLYIIMAMALIYLAFKIFVARQQMNNQLRVANLEKQHSEEILDTKQQFFTNISHEFRTPLSLIMPPIKQVINSGTVKGKNLEMLQLAEKNSKRLLTLVNQILDFRKLETEDIPLIKTDADLVAFCNDIFQSFKDLASRHEIKYNFTSNASQFITSFDKEKTEAILFNILGNAFKHTPVEGAISLKIHIPIDTKKNVEISVSDSGSGIPANELDKIFDQFYQSDIHRDQKQGTGIGLAMAREYALLHKGNIEVSSEVGKGSTFTYNFPAEKSANPIITETISNNNEILSKEKVQNQSDLKKLLIIDDNPDILDYIEMNLNTSYQIFRAANGKAGLEKADRIKPDIIVSDIMMPVMDGIQMCKQLKSNPDYQRIPIILLTAKALDKQKTEGMVSGANMYITKPFDIAYLKACVNNLVQTESVLYQYIKNKLIINPETERSAENNQNELFIKKVMEIISQNVSNPDLTVELISSEIGLSSTHLYRKIKSITNQSTKDVIKNYRLNTAAHMIKNNEGNITEIMYSVGFSSLSSFSKSFKSMFGCNPSDYKN